MNSKVLSILFILSFVTVLVLVLPLGIAPNTPGPNYKNVTVWTRVNLTNSRPEVLNVTFQDAANASLKNITISAGVLKTVYCNASLRDWNGFGDIIYVNATIWHASTSNSSDLDNNNSHYTNNSCYVNATTSQYIGWFVCSFDILYYANNGTWTCNVTAEDNANTTGAGLGNNTFYPVYALNITDGIDYGAAAVEDFTQNVTANITNIGNMAINVSVEGYGARKGDNLSMNCSLGGNITIGNQRFSTENVDWDFKIPMNGSSQPLSNLTLLKHNDSQVVTNSTYWQLYINSTNNPGGNCTGFIIFTAVVS